MQLHTPMEHLDQGIASLTPISPNSLICGASKQLLVLAFAGNQTAARGKCWSILCLCGLGGNSGPRVGSAAGFNGMVPHIQCLLCSELRDWLNV